LRDDGQRKINPERGAVRIFVAAGRGFGQTTLSAFDAALNEAGILNYNLSKLSSIVPPGTTVEIVQRYDAPEDDYGKMLFLVLAERRCDVIGKTIGAGLGWYQWGDGRGVFAEHTEITDNPDAETLEADLRRKIERTIQDLCDFRQVPFDASEVKAAVATNRVSRQPACALVAAVYKAQGF
jgi:arginine decarboxylase